MFLIDSRFHLSMHKSYSTRIPAHHKEGGVKKFNSKPVLFKIFFNPDSNEIAIPAVDSYYELAGLSAFLIRLWKTC